MNISIHPSAIIAPGAELDHNIQIGAYTMIGPRVKIASGTTIGSHSVIEGCTRIGYDNKISSFVSLGSAPQDMKYRGEETRLEIGHRNTIREFVTIHSGTAQDQGVTSVGNDNWIMTYVHVAHDCYIGDHTIFASNAQIAGHVQVGHWAVLGGMSSVHQFVRIGTHAMLAGASALRQDIPPFVAAAGYRAVPYSLNFEGLKRRGFDKEDVKALKKAYRLLYRSGTSLEEAQQNLKKLLLVEVESARPHLQAFLDFISGSIRGLAR